MSSHSNVEETITLPADHPAKKQCVAVPEWLSARYLLRSLDDKIIESCYHEIIDSFVSKKEIISTLVRASTSLQLKNIIKILKNAQNKVMDTLTNNCFNSNDSYFDVLSIESVFNICEFLEYSDLLSFKLTSTFISLIVFDLMKTYKIGVFNMNELIEQPDYQYPTHGHLNLNKKIKINYIKPYIKYSVLMNTYCSKYNIYPISNMLILQSFKSHGFSVSMGNAYDVNEHIYNNSLCKSKIVKNMISFTNKKIEKKREFFIFDKTKIFKLNNNYNNTNAISDMSNIDNIINNKYNIALLQYFDLTQQKLQNIQFLWVCHKTKLKTFEKYLINDLYPIYFKTYKYLSSEWCLDFLQTINKMKQFQNSSDCKLINVYLRKRINVNCVSYVKYSAESYNLRNKNDTISDMDKDFTIITFELNAKHPYFMNHLQISNININNAHPFYTNVSDSVRDQTGKQNIKIKYIHSKKILLDHIKYFGDIGCESYDYDNLDMTITVTPLTTFGMIKKQICLKFNNIIENNQIEIFRGKSSNGNSMWNNYQSSWNNKINSLKSYHIVSVENNSYKIAKNHNNYSYKFEILPFRHLKIRNGNSNNYHIYNVSLFEKEIDFNDFSNYTNIGSSFNNEIDDEPIKQTHIKYNKFKKKINSNNNNNKNNNNKNNNNETNDFSPLQLSNHETNVRCTNTLIEINIKHFMETMIEIMSHSMYNDTFTYFIKKYMEKSKYSFVLFSENEDNLIEFYDINSFYCHDNFYQYGYVNYFNINILVLHNIMINKFAIDHFDDEEKKEEDIRYPLIVRFNTIENEDNDVKQEIGFPVQIWIDQQCKAQQIINACFQNISNRFKLYQCKSVKYGNINVNESIYNKIFKHNHTNNSHTCLYQVVITLQIIDNKSQ